MDADKWDIEAKPDTPGTPSIEQMRLMMQQVLADRFALKVHGGEAELWRRSP